jgi:putative restriction endonuclease
MIDHQIRLKVFEWLTKQIQIHGDVLPRKLLAEGFIFESEHIPLVSPQGIFKPKWLDYPLSITTTPKGPYEDRQNDEGLIEYKYRGTDPNHRDNVGLRKAFEKQIPLIYFFGITPGKYMTVWPVYIVGDDPQNLTFTVAGDEQKYINSDDIGVNENSIYRRSYITSTIKNRLHQRSFRERVLEAYRSKCTVCRLKHLELLDAAHIIPDTEPESKPTVDNGLALCKLHHAAFDSFIIGITPDFRIEIRSDVLEEHDGPMLKHGLIELHGSNIILPAQKNNWPNRDYLDTRYQKFKKVG